MAKMGEDVAEDLRRLAPEIAHIQFADCPGRHEPGTGELDLTALFAQLAESGYVGAVAAEYRPSGDSADSLGWWLDD
jgi:hydroxypyruvate isomerase